MAEMTESNEVLQALGAVSAFFVKAAADGFDPINDTASALRDDALMDTVADGLTDSDEVPGEFTRAGLREWLNLAMGAASAFRGAGA